MVDKKQACRYAGNACEMKFQPLEIEQEQDTRSKIQKLPWKLHLHLRIKSARAVQCVNGS
jgi:hypothetical protein